MRIFSTCAIGYPVLFLLVGIGFATVAGCRSRTFDRGPLVSRARLDPSGKAESWGLKQGTVGPTRSPDAKVGEIAASRLLLAEGGARAFGLPSTFSVLDGLAAIPLNLGNSERRSGAATPSEVHLGASPFHLGWPAGAPTLPFLAVWLRIDSAGVEKAGLFLEVGDPLVERASAKAKEVLVEISGERLSPWRFKTTFVRSALAWRVTLLDEEVFEATSIRPASHGATDALPAELSSRLSTVVSSGLRGKVIVDGKGEGHSFPLSFRFPSGLIFGPTSGPTSGRLADPCDAAPLMGTGLASRDASKAFVVPAGAGWRGFQGGAESSNLENASAQTSLLAALGSKGTDAKDDENPYGAKDIAVFRALRPREFLAVAPGESSWFAVDSTAPDCAKVRSQGSG